MPAMNYKNQSLRLLTTIGLLRMVIGLTACTNQHTTADEAAQPKKEKDWHVLLNSDETRGWRSTEADAFPDKGWTLQNGLLTGTGDGGDIISTEQYGNFELEWEWKMLTEGGNSGVKYFVRDYGTNEKSLWLGLEYQILDDENFLWMKDGRMKPGDFRTLASLYEIYPAENKTSKPVGEWNTSRIVSRGQHTEHWLNGQIVLQYERGSDDFREKVRQSKFAAYEKFGEADKGHILIQDHGSEMVFRNMRIRELSVITKHAGR